MEMNAMPAKKAPTALEITELLEDAHGKSIRALDMASGHAPGSAKHGQYLTQHDRHNAKFYEHLAALKLLVKTE
jgi:surfactin synthase thioesterase subunit